MATLRLQVETVDVDGSPLLFWLTRGDLEAIFEEWLKDYGRASPHYVAELKDATTYGTDSAREFIRYAKKVSGHE